MTLSTVYYGLLREKLQNEKNGTKEIIVGKLYQVQHKIPKIRWAKQ